MKKSLNLFLVFAIGLITVFTCFLIAHPERNKNTEGRILQTKYIPSTDKIIRVEIVSYDHTSEPVSSLGTRI